MRFVLIRLGILGATVMPHNLYLHSNIVKNSDTSTAASSDSNNQGRNNASDTAQSSEYTNIQEGSPTTADRDIDYIALGGPAAYSPSLRERLKYASIDSIFSLILASLVNASILIVAAASFHRPDGEPADVPAFQNGTNDHDGDGIADLQDAHALLSQHLGPAAGILFGIGLLMSGQSSTITGTLAGQVVMEVYTVANLRASLANASPSLDGHVASSRG